MTQKVIVTGGSGFIGSVLVDQLLDEGVQVLNIDREEPFRYPEVWPGPVDVCDEQQLDQAVG